MSAQGRDKLDRQRLEKFCQLIAESKTVTDACKVIRCSRIAIYAKRKKDAAFAAAWDEAEKVGTGFLEDEALKRSKRSDNLLMFLLKARKPEKYRDGPRGGSLQMPGAGKEGDIPSTGLKFTFDFGNDTKINPDA